MNPNSYFMPFFTTSEKARAHFSLYTNTQLTKFCCILRQFYCCIVLLCAITAIATLFPTYSASAQPCANLQIDYVSNGDCYGDTPCQVYQYAMTSATNYNTNGYALYLPNFPANEQNFVFAPNSGGTQFYFIDGDLRIVGTLQSVNDPNKKFHIDLWLDNKQNWNAWNAMNPTFAAANLYRDNSGFGAGGAYANWSYFTVDASKPNTLVGDGDYAGYTLNLSHNFDAPTNHYAFQVGAEGANNQNGNYGLSGLVNYNADVSPDINSPLPYMSSGGGEIAMAIFCPPKQCSGNVAINMSGGTAPYHYVWSNGVIGSVQSGLCAGSYFVTVTDGAGCSAAQQVIIGFVANPLVYLGIDQTSCNAITLDATTLGASQYQWNSGATSAMLTVAQSGTYSVTVSNSNGCTSSDAININISPLNVELGPNQIVCEAITLNAGSGYNTYLWNNGASTQSIIADHNGTYSVTVTNANGCTASDNMSVLIDTPNVDLGNDITICNSTTNLDAGGGYVAYQWNTGETTQSISVGSGTYSVTVTNANGCTASDMVNVNISSNAVVELGNNHATCNSSEILDATVPFGTYQWSTGANAPSITVNESGTYSVTVTSQGGCTASDAVMISFLPSPTINLGNDISACSVATIDAGNQYSAYLWSNGSTATNITVTQSGTYSVTVTNSVGCTASDMVNINISSNAVVELGNNHATCNSSEILDATVPFGTYQWSTGANAPSITVNESGTYSVTVTSQGGCTASDAVMISFLPSPTINLGNDISACSVATIDAGNQYSAYLWSNGSTATNITVTQSGTYSVTVTNSVGCTASDAIYVTINQGNFLFSLGNDITACNSATLSAGFGYSNYAWSNGSNSASITVSESGTYSVTVSNSSGCTATDAVNVTINNTFNFNLGNDISNCSSAVIQAAFGYNSYLWNTGETTPMIVANNSGTYSVTVTNFAGCTASDAVNVVISPDTFVELGSNHITCSSSEILDATVPFGTYQWSTGDNTPSITVTNSGTYSVTVTGQGGCTASDAVAINFLPNVNINLGSDINTCAANATLNAGNGYAFYQWSNGANSPSITVTNSGTYSVTVTNSAGCTASDAVNVALNSGFSYSLGADISSCIVATTLNAGNGYAAYQWSNGANSQSITVNNSGTYSVTVTNNAGCTASDAVNVNISNGLFIDLGDDYSTCNSLAFLDLAVPAGIYQWSTGANTSGIMVNESGTYSVTVTGQGGCTASDAITITFGTAINLNLGNNINTCAANATLNAGNGYASYQWSNGANSPSITVTNSGTYSVTVTNSAGCTASDAINVNVSGGSGFSFSLGEDINTCGSATIGAGSGYASYNWNTGATWQSITVNESGTYSVTVTNSAGCTASDAINVNVGGGSGFSFSLGDDINTCGSATIGAGSGYASYNWNTGATWQSITVNESGTYSVTVTNSAGCTASDAINVNVSGR
jgi:hypothetical protein